MDQKSPEAFRTISEVADWLGVPTHVLRFWESRFSQVKPVKRAGGRRYYRPSDMELLGGIRRLLHDDGMTIRGVQKLLREKGVKHVAAMSPPLDMAGESTPGNVVDLSDRRTEATDKVAEAETVDEAAEEVEEKRGFPFDDDEPAPVKPIAAPAEATPAAETAQEPEVAPAMPPEPAPVQEEDAAPDAFDADDSLPSPDAMEFLAHDAAPETDAGDTYDARTVEVEVEVEAAAPGDPMSSPEALDYAAHDAEPSHEDEADAVETEAPVASAEPEPEPEHPAPEHPAPERPAPERPALVMPDIDADPDDDDRESGTLIAATLRDIRSQRARVNTSALQALADRLDEISRRFDAGRNAGPF